MATDSISTRALHPEHRAALEVDAAIKAIERHTWTVEPDDDPGLYLVSMTMTAKGLADFAAELAQPKDEQFLQLIVCVCPRDRFKALDIRERDGVTAALDFIRQCNVTDEAIAEGKGETEPLYDDTFGGWTDAESAHLTAVDDIEALADLMVSSSEYSLELKKSTFAHLGFMLERYAKAAKESFGYVLEQRQRGAS